MTAGNSAIESLGPEPDQVLGKRPAGSELDANTEDAPSEPPASEAGPSTLTWERKPKSAKPKKESKRAKIRDRSPRPLRGTRPEGSEHPSLAEGEERTMRLPKRPSALLLGFAGTGYSGMQVYVLFYLSHEVVVLKKL
jgi:tRNA pseudouridine38-40 synthase